MTLRTAAVLLGLILAFCIYIDRVSISQWIEECEKAGMTLHLPQHKGDAYYCVTRNRQPAV